MVQGGAKRRTTRMVLFQRATFLAPCQASCSCTECSFGAVFFFFKDIQSTSHLCRSGYEVADFFVVANTSPRTPIETRCLRLHGALPLRSKTAEYYYLQRLSLGGGGGGGEKEKSSGVPPSFCA